MRLRLPDLEITPDDPFRNDGLERKEFAEALTSLVGAVEGGGVLTLEGAWGTGKTTFLRMWQELLKADGFETIRFSAWETDHCDDPMISLLGEFESQVDTSDQSKSGWQAKAVSAGKLLFKKGLPLAVRAATYGAVEIDAASEAALSQLGEKLTEKAIADYTKEKQALQSFREAIASLSAQSDMPIVVLVDELDRCRPTYAIEMLERIKHLFGVDGVVFALAIDRDQMGHSIRSIYGSGMDPDGYLRRFIDLPCAMPRPNVEQFTKTIFDRFGLMEEIRKRSEFRFDCGDAGESLEMLSSLFTAYSVPLRTIEQIVCELSIVFAVTPTNNGILPMATAGLLFVRHLDRRLCEQFLNGERDAASLMATLREDSRFSQHVPYRTSYLMELWLRLVSQNREIDGFADLKNIPADDPGKEKADELVEAGRRLSFHYSGGALRRLRQKLSFSEKIVSSSE